MGVICQFSNANYAEGDVDMFLGSRDAFAIEAELIEFYGNWIYGRLRLWVGGVAFGDFDDTSDLASSARWGRTFLSASPRRTRADLDHVSPEDVFERLYGRFVVRIGEPRTNKDPGPWNQAPHVLDYVGESALRDRCAVVVVRRGDGADRLLLKSFEPDRLLEHVVAPGICDEVIRAYCTWVEQLTPDAS